MNQMNLKYVTDGHAWYDPSGIISGVAGFPGRLAAQIQRLDQLGTLIGRVELTGLEQAEASIRHWLGQEPAEDDEAFCRFLAQLVGAKID